MQLTSQILILFQGDLLQENGSYLGRFNYYFTRGLIQGEVIYLGRFAGARRAVGTFPRLWRPCLVGAAFCCGLDEAPWKTKLKNWWNLNENEKINLWHYEKKCASKWLECNFFKQILINDTEFCFKMKELKELKWKLNKYLILRKILLQMFGM